MNKQLATLGGGCFWCLEAAFKEVPGVIEVYSGYAGGFHLNPTYNEVCQGKTGHAEVVQLIFNTDQICYRDLLLLFFRIHDPTTLNAQGNDLGPQYRSIILTHDADQAREAKSIADEIVAANIYNSPLVTEIKPLQKFFLAESEHANYYQRHPEQAYCQMVVASKIDKMRRLIKFK